MKYEHCKQLLLIEDNAFHPDPNAVSRKKPCSRGHHSFASSSNHLTYSYMTYGFGVRYNYMAALSPTKAASQQIP